MHAEEESSAILALLLATAGLIVALFLVSQPAEAERPFRSDEPYTVGMHRWKGAGGLSIGSGSWEGVSGRSQLDFELSADYGLNERMEVGVEASMFRVNDPGADGFGRFDAHFKHQFGEATPEWPDMGYDLRLRIPSGNRVDPAGDGKVELIAAYLLGWRGERWTTTARLGYAHTASSRLTNRFELGLAGRYLVAPDVRLLGEIYLDSNERPFQDSRLQFGAGVAYNATPSTTLDLMLVAGTTDSVPDVAVRTGLTTKL